MRVGNLILCKPRHKRWLAGESAAAFKERDKRTGAVLGVVVEIEEMFNCSDRYWIHWVDGKRSFVCESDEAKVMS